VRFTDDLVIILEGLHLIWRYLKIKIQTKRQNVVENMIFAYEKVN